MFWIKKAVATAVAAMVMITAAGVIVGMGVQQSGAKVVAQEVKIEQGQASEAKRIQELKLIDEIEFASEYILRLEKMKLNVSGPQSEREKDIERFDHLIAFYNCKQRINLKLHRLSYHLELVVMQAPDFSNELKQKSIIKQFTKNTKVELETELGNNKSTENLLRAINEYEAMSNEIDRMTEQYPRFQIFERPANGDSAIQSTAINDQYLLIQLKRIVANPIGDRSLIIRVEPNAKKENVDQALKSAAAVGIRNGRLCIHSDSKLQIANHISRIVGNEREYDVPDFSKVVLETKSVKPKP